MAPRIQIRYFARIREKLGLGEEVIELRPDMQTLHSLRADLALRGEAWAELVGPNASTLMVALNQNLLNISTDVELADHDEVAFFPPVTGG